ncbi:hypothetical protein ACFL20_10070 [Spirochaetota bacterium]
MEDKLGKKLDRFWLLIDKPLGDEFLELIKGSSKKDLIYFMLLCKNVKSPDRVLAFLNGELHRRISLVSYWALGIAIMSVVASTVVAVLVKVYFTS